MAVKVYQRKSKKGIVYYLDTNHDGIRLRKTLKIDFTISEKKRLAIATAFAKQENEELMPGAAHVKSRNFIALFSEHIKEARYTHRKYSNTLRHFIIKFGDKISTKQITVEMMQTWKAYLESNFNGETPLTMWAATKKVINILRKRGVIPIDPFMDIKPPRVSNTITKPILSVSEFMRLSKTPMPHAEICKAFLFCCYTGMTRADILGLSWSSIDLERKQVNYKRVKTKQTVIVDLTDSAISLLPERLSDKVFFAFPSDSYCSRSIKQWRIAAGITKNISWYSSRHTFAVLVLEGGADLHTVSKLLGHSTLKHTSKYLKHADGRRRVAVEQLPDILS